MKKLWEIFKRQMCQHDNTTYKGGYLDRGVRLCCTDCGKRVVVPMQIFMALENSSDVKTATFNNIINLRKGKR
jgi:hypothetical protein